MAHAFGDDAEVEFKVHPGNETSQILCPTYPRVPSLILWEESPQVRPEYARIKSEEKRQKKLPAGRPEVNLSESDWVVVDEADGADVLFGTPGSVSKFLPFSCFASNRPRLH
jgi:hypothetical protein